MANEYKIEINKRKKISSKNVKELRKEGNIPGIYYSASSKESIPIFISNKVYNDAIKSGARIFNILVGDSKKIVLFKSVQYHPVTDEVLHVDLYGVQMDKAVTIKVPIELIGDSIGVIDEGGLLNQPLNEIEIQCLPGDIPDSIKLDISQLSMGDSLNAGDITLDDKFTLATSEEAVVVSVTQPMKEIEPVVELETDEEFLDEDGVTDDSEEDGNKKEEAKEDQDGDSSNKKDEES